MNQDQIQARLEFEAREGTFTKPKRQRKARRAQADHNCEIAWGYCPVCGLDDGTR